MKRYEYENYSAYVNAQRVGWSKKRNKVWADRENIQVMAWILHFLNPTFGICHGARTGAEQEWFAECIPGCKVIGTDIGDGNNTITWDFNEQNPKWVGAADFVYSNAFDHAYDLISTLRVWYAQLKEGGLMLLEHAEGHGHDGSLGRKINKTDPIGISLPELVAGIPKWIEGTWAYATPLPNAPGKGGARNVVVVTR